MSLLRFNTDAERGIGYEENLRQQWISSAYLSDDAVRSDHRHSAFNAAAGTTVNEHSFGRRDSAVSDYPRGHCFGRKLRLKDGQRARILSGRKLVPKIHIFHSQPVVVGLQAAV